LGHESRFLNKTLEYSGVLDVRSLSFTLVLYWRKGFTRVTPSFLLEERMVVSWVSTSTFL
jgi:hypothetical protein